MVHRPDLPAFQQCRVQAAQVELAAAVRQRHGGAEPPGEGLASGGFAGGHEGHQSAPGSLGLALEGLHQRPAQAPAPRLRVDDQIGVRGVQVLGQAVFQAGVGQRPPGVPDDEMIDALAGCNVGQLGAFGFGNQGGIVGVGESVALGLEDADSQALGRRRRSGVQ